MPVTRLYYWVVSFYYLKAPLIMKLTLLKPKNTIYDNMKMKNKASWYAGKPL